jgi:hypothetical protein
MSYSEQMQKIVEQYRISGEEWPATTHQIAEWAIRHNRWKPQPSTVIAQCSEHLARAMREEYVTDPQGRRVRVKHVAIVERNGEQLAFWADIRNASTEHMQLSFQQRRQQIVGDCRQLKCDVDSFNDNGNKDSPINMVFDFTLDLEEIELAAKRARKRVA